MVCPTCFCTTIEDVSDVTGDHAERWRRWDSCFTLSFSYIHGGSVRTSGKARYRQWLTHKLASWTTSSDRPAAWDAGAALPGAPRELTSPRKCKLFAEVRIMETQTLEKIIADHPFFADLETYYTSLLVSCATNLRFPPASTSCARAKRPTSFT